MPTPGNKLSQFMLWRGAPIGPPVVPSLVTRAAARGILYGGVVNFNYLKDLDYRKYLVSEYAGGLIAIETGGSMNRVEPTRGSFSFSNVDACLNFWPAGQTPTMRWYLFPSYPSDPNWAGTGVTFQSLVTTRAGAISVMQQYINAVAAKYPYPQIKYVNLYNEIIKFGGFVSDAFKTALGINYTGASTASGTAGFIACAYDFCMQAWGPNIKLGLNFNHQEPETADGTSQRNLILQAYQGMAAAGRPLHWMGNEFHGNQGVVVTSQASVASYYAALANLGAELHGTEIDCNDVGRTFDNVTRDNDANTNLMPSLTTLMANPACTVVQTWLDNDRYNWECYPPKGRGNPGGNGSVGRTDGVAGRVTPKDWAMRLKANGNLYNNFGALIDVSGSGVTRHDVTVVIGQTQTVLSLATGVQSAAFAVPPAVSVTNSTQGSNEPAGYTVVADTGPLTTAPPTTQNAQWSNGGGTKAITWTVFSPGGAQPASGYTTGWAGNLKLTSLSDPTSTGYRIFYPSGVAGGNSPVRFGAPVAGTAPTGGYYQRCRLRASPGYTNNGNVTTKFMFFQTGGPSNHFLPVGWDANQKTTHLWGALGLQGNTPQAGLTFDAEPGGLGSLGAGGDIGDGQWHTVEWLLQNTHPVGTANGICDIWVDGVHVVHRTGFQAFQSSDSGTVNFLMWDPTYGGGLFNPPTASPPQPLFIDWDQYHMSMG